MPQDTTIYWNGYDEVPALIDSLPYEQKAAVLHEVLMIRDEQEQIDPVWIVLSLAGFAIFFSIAAIIGNRKKKRSGNENG